jgi:hypothetical protein
MDFSFLKSNRFWSLVVIALVWIAGQQGFISPEIVAAIEVILGGHIVIRTTDRFSETIAEGK